MHLENLLEQTTLGAKLVEGVLANFVIIFMMLFVFQSWRRQENELALKWNTTQIERKEILRPEFHGELQTSLVTGKPERFYPTWKRILLYLLSFIFTLPFLLVAVGAMILSLNFNGYVKDKESPIYLGTLARFSEPVSCPVSVHSD